MISHGEGFVIRHRSGRYFNSSMVGGSNTSETWRSDYVPPSMIFRLFRNPFAADLVASETWCGRFLTTPEWQAVAGQFEVVPGPGCGCCGARWGTMWGDDGQYRCDKHKDRNPCAIEGCRCTTARGEGREMQDDQYLCSKHWRPLTTVAERRVYSRIWREAKARERKLGREHMWPMSEVRRLERVWDRIVAKARSRAAGDIDMDEINKMFGLD